MSLDGYPVNLSDAIGIWGNAKAIGETPVIENGQYGEVIASIAAQLSAANGEQGWPEIVEISKRLGVKAINVGVIDRETNELLWARSSMSASWLEIYETEKFHEVDPLLWASRKGWLPELHPAGEPLPGMAADPRQAKLREGLLEYGYAWFWGHIWPDPQNNRIVCMAAPVDPSEAFGSATKSVVRTVSALIAAHLQPPTSFPSHLFGRSSHYSGLSNRERRVLQLLARGLGNLQIAHSMGIAEVTVRLHLRNARKKMGAATREQALALALVRGQM